MKKIAVFIGALVLAAAAFVAFKMLQPVPEGLDLATTRLTDNGAFSVTITPENPDFRRSDMHSWIAEVKTADGAPVETAEIAIDGGMPQHGHGLPTSPQMTENLGGGRYLIEGVRFNMSGWWEFRLAISAGGTSDSVTFNLVF